MWLAAISEPRVSLPKKFQLRSCSNQRDRATFFFKHHRSQDRLSYCAAFLTLGLGLVMLWCSDQRPLLPWNSKPRSGSRSPVLSVQTRHGRGLVAAPSAGAVSAVKYAQPFSLKPAYFGPCSAPREMHGARRFQAKFTPSTTTGHRPPKLSAFRSAVGFSFFFLNTEARFY